MIRNRARNGNYITQRESPNFVATEFQKTLTYGWLDSCLSQRVDEVPTVKTARSYISGCNNSIDKVKWHMSLIPLMWMIGTSTQSKVRVGILRKNRTQRNGGRIMQNCCQQKAIFSFKCVVG
jgi:hypothetical protein